MFYTYVLYSKKFNKIYIGYTSDLEDRFLSHNEKATKGYTVRFRPWVVAFYEEFPTKVKAMKREKELKSSRGRNYIWNKLDELGLISVS
ncbi:MAG: GIY-YIG nuclease family protein [Crocinitomix sp.]|nr:GIY-YIG nuclease family protein [Crocinitomix sp.]